MTTQTSRAEGKEINKAWFYFVISLFVFSTQTAVLMVPALLVEIATDLEVSVAVAGQLNTATFAARAVSLVFAGPLADSFGRRPVALVGMLLLVGSVLASDFAPNTKYSWRFGCWLASEGERCRAHRLGWCRTSSRRKGGPRLSPVLWVPPC